MKIRKPANSPLDVYSKSLELIPGGTQLFSKKPELFNIDVWPIYFQSAKGIKVRAWTANDPFIVEQLFALGVDMVMSDYPELI